MKKKILAILSLLLVSISIFCMINTKYYPPLGDVFLDHLGLMAWSKGNGTGFHLTIIYFLFPLIIGLFGVEGFFYQEFKIRGFKLFLIICLILTILTIGTNSFAEYSKSNVNGLNSIEYFRDESSCTFNVDGTTVSEFKGIFMFQNHSNQKRSFYIKFLYTGEGIIQELYHTKEFIGYEKDNVTPKLITLEPKEKKLIEVEFNKNPTKENIVYGGSQGKDLEVIIYDDKEEVKFMNDNLFGVVINK